MVVFSLGGHGSSEFWLEYSLRCTLLFVLVMRRSSSNCIATRSRKSRRRNFIPNKYMIFRGGMGLMSITSNSKKLFVKLKDFMESENSWDQDLIESHVRAPNDSGVGEEWRVARIKWYLSPHDIGRAWRGLMGAHTSQVKEMIEECKCFVRPHLFIELSKPWLLHNNLDIFECKTSCLDATPLTQISMNKFKDIGNQGYHISTPTGRAEIHRILQEDQVARKEGSRKFSVDKSYYPPS